jgi:hypothetical protein
VVEKSGLLVFWLINSIFIPFALLKTPRKDPKHLDKPINSHKKPHKNQNQLKT